MNEYGIGGLGLYFRVFGVFCGALIPACRIKNKTAPDAAHSP